MIEVNFRCDKCGTGFFYEVNSCGFYPTKKFLVETARYLGFTVGKKILCPDCNQKPNLHKEEYELLKMKGRERI